MLGWNLTHTCFWEMLWDLPLCLIFNLFYSFIKSIVPEQSTQRWVLVLGLCNCHVSQNMACPINEPKMFLCSSGYRADVQDLAWVVLHILSKCPSHKDVGYNTLLLRLQHPLHHPTFTIFPFWIIWRVSHPQNMPLSSLTCERETEMERNWEREINLRLPCFIHLSFLALFI